MVNKKFVRRKVALIIEELEHLQDFSDYSFKKIADDFNNQAIVERILERVINRSIDINQHLISELIERGSLPKTYKETFTALAEINVLPKDFAKEIAKSVGTRNILVHEYDKVNYEQIYSSIKDCLEDYHQYCQYIIDFVNEPREENEKEA